MATKISAAKLCTDSGIDMVIANGSAPDVIYKIIGGESVGTRFAGKK